MIKKLLTYGASEVLTRLVPILTSFLLAKSLGPEKFGELALFLVINEILYIVISNNIQATLRVNFFKLDKVLLNNEIIKNVIYSLAIAFFCFVLAFIYFIITNESFLLILVCIALIRSVSQLSLAIFQCNKVSNIYLIVQFSFVATFFILLLCFLEHGIYSWFVAMFGGVAIQASSSVFYLKKYNLFAFNHLRFIKFNKESVVFGLSFMPQAIGWWMKNGIDRYLITINYGLMALGFYALAYQFSSSLIMLISVINLTIVPELNALLKSGNFSKVNIIYIISFIVIAVASVVVFYISEWAILYFYPEYSTSLQYLGVIMLVVTSQSFSLILMNELYFVGKSVFVAKVVLFVFSFQSLGSYFIASYLAIESLIYSSLLFNLVLFIIVSRGIIKSRALTHS